MKYIVENFKSIEHLILSNETRPNNKVFDGKHSSEEGDADFCETRTYSEAVDLIKNGYAKPLEEIKRGVEVNTRALKSSKTAIKNDIVGYAPCVPNAILGIPQSMINKDTAVKKSKIITVCYDATANCGTSTETFIKAGIAVLTIINSLEADGYRVALKVSFFNAKENSDERVFATVMLKDWRQPLDLKKMAFPFCHPSMLRRIGFKWLETCPELTASGWRWGYGTPANNDDYKDTVDTLLNNKLIGENEKFINIKLCRQNNFDPKAIAKACGLE